MVAVSRPNRFLPRTTDLRTLSHCVYTSRSVQDPRHSEEEKGESHLVTAPAASAESAGSAGRINLV